MFERTRIDNIPEPSAVPVEVDPPRRLDDSRAKCSSRRQSALRCAQRQRPFLEFEPYGGDRRFLAKARSRHCKLVGVPKAGNLHVTRDGPTPSTRTRFWALPPDGRLGGDPSSHIISLPSAITPTATPAPELARRGAGLPGQHGPPRQCRLRRPRHSASGREDSNRRRTGRRRLHARFGLIQLTGRACRGAALMSRVQTVTLCEPALSNAPSRRARPGIC